MEGERPVSMLWLASLFIYPLPFWSGGKGLVLTLPSVRPVRVRCTLLSPTAGAAVQLVERLKLSVRIADAGSEFGLSCVGLGSSTTLISVVIRKKLHSPVKPFAAPPLGSVMILGTLDNEIPTYLD